MLRVAMTMIAWSRVEARLDDVPTFHAARAGKGVPLLLVHGIGPGTTGAANFAPLVAAVPTEWPIHMIDLAGFGQSAQAAPIAPFDASRWVRQIRMAIDAIGEPVLLVGNSVGGALALKVAAGGANLHAVVTVGAPAAAMVPTSALRAFWSPPASRDALAEAIRPMTGRAEAPPAAVVDQRWSAFADAAYCARFAAGLAAPEALLAQVALDPAEAVRITVPVHVLHGRKDRACPAAPVVEAVLRLLPHADATLLGRCGHNVLSERTADAVRILHAIRDGNDDQ